MSHCFLYEDKYKKCRDYPTYCDNRCCMYRPTSAKEVGEALKKLIDRIKEIKNED